MLITFKKSYSFCVIMQEGCWILTYCKVDVDSNFYAQYSNMIGPLAKFVRASNSSKTVLRYFCKVLCKSNVCIIQFYWLIPLYLFTLLPCNASFLIVKNSFVREEVSDLVFFFRHAFNRSLCKNIFLVSSYSCPLPLFHAPPQLTLFPSPTTFRMCTFLSASPSTAAPCAVDNFQRLQRQIYIFDNPN